MEKILGVKFQVSKHPIALYTLFSTALAEGATLSIKSKATAAFTYRHDVHRQG